MSEPARYNWTTSLSRLFALAALILFILAALGVGSNLLAWGLAALAAAFVV